MSEVVSSDDFLRACNKKDYQQMDKLIKLGVDINVKNIKNITPLMSALLNINADLEMVKWLLNNGADPGVPNTEGDNCFHLLAKKEYPDLLKLILKHIKNKEDINAQNALGSTPLMEACGNKKEINVELLLKSNANPNIKSLQGATALLIAAGKHDDKIVELLLKANADPDSANNYGITALMSGAQLLTRYDDPEDMKKSLSVVRLLLNANADPNKKSDSENTAIAEAANGLNMPVVLELLKHNVDPNTHSNSTVKGQLTPLMIASLKHDVKVVEELLNHGANPNYKNFKGDTALRYCLNTQIASQKDRENCVETIKLLLKFGAEMDFEGMGLGHFAVISDSIDLLEIAADKKILDQQDKEGHTPLHVSIYTFKDKMIDALLNKGVDLNIKDNNGKTALVALSEFALPANIIQTIMLLKKQSDQVKKENGEKLEKELKDGWFNIIKKLINAGAEINSLDNNGNIPFGFLLKTYAAGVCEKDVIDFYLNSGTDLSIKNNDGDNSLIIAIKFCLEDLSIELGERLIKENLFDSVKSVIYDLSWGNPEDSERLIKIKPILLKLIELGADVNFQDEDGQTPLIIASARNQESFLELLIELGADLNLKNKEGEVALTQAIANGHSNITKILLNKNANPNIKNNDGEDLISVALRYQHKSIIDQLREVINNPPKAKM